PLFFFCNAPAPTDIYTLSLHDALPISPRPVRPQPSPSRKVQRYSRTVLLLLRLLRRLRQKSRSTNCGDLCPRSSRLAGHSFQTPDRKSTRLNSSHVEISYAVFCLKKKT